MFCDSLTHDAIVISSLNMLYGDNKHCNMKQSGFLKEGSTCLLQYCLYEHQNKALPIWERTASMKIKPNDKSIKGNDDILSKLGIK